MKKRIIWAMALVLGVGSSLYFYTSVHAGPIASTTTARTTTVQRRIMPLGLASFTTIFSLIPAAPAQHALFYLVDAQGNPIGDKASFSRGIGSKSVKAPFFAYATPQLQSYMSYYGAYIVDDVGDWVDTYLSNVYAYRTGRMNAAALQAYQPTWRSLSQAYDKALMQIFRYMVISPDAAVSLGLVTVTGAPITLLFFDDPFPPHTRLGTSVTPFQDLLGNFIKGYGFTVPSTTGR